MVQVQQNHEHSAQLLLLGPTVKQQQRGAQGHSSTIFRKKFHSAKLLGVRGKFGGIFRNQLVLNSPVY